MFGCHFGVSARAAQIFRADKKLSASVRDAEASLRRSIGVPSAYQRRKKSFRRWYAVGTQRKRRREAGATGAALGHRDRDALPSRLLPQKAGRFRSRKVRVNQDTDATLFCQATPNAMPELYTIGYEGMSQDALFQTLLFHDVQALLDIRERPQSRKPGLSKSALDRAAASYGMRYDHIRALGTPRDIRYRRKIDHDQQAFEAGFLEYLATQDAAVDALVVRAQAERCCLLCFEADVRECHRLFVAARAAERSGGALTVLHLAGFDAKALGESMPG